ncbi:ATPase-AAA-core domain-containing protein [Mycena sanguinolenta]|uniref:ATPase-AAA-core domain-containing protein n=1 Tax=Mycena sanguinolenta TaxID=230812 RepID=A0A8H7D265_9AGAR|nr:ATPase-AAA-core domain-containing protein [Mycena sanguinolenta]
MRLGIIITMRGSERPAQVRWTRPFLPPLRPLTNDAAEQIFMEITDDTTDVVQLLTLTDNMPLAVDLIAHLAAFEGSSSVLARWKTEKTTLLSRGYDRKSSLDASIEISLSSPRMSSFPGAHELLALLSILPDGLSDADLQTLVPIPGSLECRTALLRTSLAYNDPQKRLKSLSPIREYMQHSHPPSLALMAPLQKHFYMVLNLYQTYSGLQQAQGQLSLITPNWGNILSILTRSLQGNNPNVADTINCAIVFNDFSRHCGRGTLELMDMIPAHFPTPCDHRLEAFYISEVFRGMLGRPIANPDELVERAKLHFSISKDTGREASFYRVIGYYYFYHKSDVPKSMEFLERALELSRLSEDMRQQSSVLNCLAQIRWNMGDSTAAQTHAQEAGRLARLAGNLYVEAQALQVEATCYSVRGDYRYGITLLQDARNLVHRYGISGGSLDHTIMRCLAQIQLYKSEYAEARSIHAELVRTCSPEQDPYDYGTSLLNIAEIDLKTGAASQDVYEAIERARQIYDDFQHSIGLLCCDLISADLDLRNGDLVAARTGFLQCLSVSRGKIVEIVSYTLERLADSRLWSTGSWDSSWPVLYLVQSHTSHDNLALQKALYFLGDRFMIDGDWNTAESLFTLALEGLTHMDVHCSRAQCILRLGELAETKGDLTAATDFWKSARPLFQRSLQTEEVSRIDARLAAADHTMNLGITDSDV